MRENREGKVVSIIDGKAVAAEVDPIEKKPLHHFYAGSRPHPIATAGCSLHSFLPAPDYLADAPKRVLPGFLLLPEEIVASANAEHCV